MIRTTLARVLGAMAFAALAACGGSGGPNAPREPVVDAPSDLTFPLADGLYRAGEAILINTPTVTGTVTSWTVTPALPAGLSLDPQTGAISGTPTAESAAGLYRVVATNAGGSVSFDVRIDVGPALPPAFDTLQLGFIAETYASGLDLVARIVLAPDGRMFCAEVKQGTVRVIDATGALLPQRFVTLPVLTNGSKGILGLALDPDFASNGYVYVLLCVAGDGMTTQDRIEVRRYTDVGNAGMNEAVLINNLPLTGPAATHDNNGGELLFDSTGRLLVTTGDNFDPAGSQADASVSLSGKVLRYEATVPATPASDNPDNTSPEWCRGLRNTFGLAVHPTTGGVFGVDNGPTDNDELLFLEGGKNYEWGSAGGLPPAVVGFTMRTWVDVIAPTALVWHTGAGWGPEFTDDLFIVSYADSTLRRIEMSGAALTDIDIESEFATFVEAGSTNKPLDAIVHPTSGDIFVSTFSGVYRIRKQ